MAEAKDMGKVPESDAGALVASGEALVRIENETQMRISLERPRDEKEILKDALTELELYKSCAEDAIYAKPVGRASKCPSCNAETRYREECPKCGARVPMTYARNLSIRTAESLANRWNNSAWACQQVADDGESVTIVAIFLDYEKNTRHVLPKRISRFYKKRNGQIVKHAEDRFADLVVPANVSKILREAILRSLPAGLKVEYRLKAERMQQSTSPEAKARMLQMFSGLGVSQAMIEHQVGKARKDFSGQDMVDLRGVYNAIEGKEITKEEAFGNGTPSEKEQSQQETVAGAPKASEVLANGKGKPEAKEPQASDEPAEPTAETAADPDKKALVARIDNAIADGRIETAVFDAACAERNIEPTQWDGASAEELEKLAAKIGV